MRDRGTRIMFSWYIYTLVDKSKKKKRTVERGLSWSRDCARQVSRARTTCVCVLFFFCSKFQIDRDTRAPRSTAERSLRTGSSARPSAIGVRPLRGTPKLRNSLSPPTTADSHDAGRLRSPSRSLVRRSPSGAYRERSSAHASDRVIRWNTNCDSFNRISRRFSHVSSSRF